MHGASSSTASISSSSTGGDPASTTGTPTEATGAGPTIGASDATGAGTGDITGEATTEGASGGTAGLDEECDPRVQDCAEGLKCTAYSERTLNTYDANKCVLEPENGGVAGEDCEVIGADLFSGIDTCAKGHICLEFDAEGEGGFCVEFCQWDGTCLATPGGFCPVGGEGTLPLCIFTCAPLLQDCPGAQACYGDPWSGPPFICYLPDPQDGGQDGSTCSFTNDCLAGLHCSESETLEDCPMDAYGCCTPFCPLDGDVCTGAEVCVAFFDEPHEGFENVGICMLPG